MLCLNVWVRIDNFVFLAAGWHEVYDVDEETLQIIRKHSDDVNKLEEWYKLWSTSIDNDLGISIILWRVTTQERLHNITKTRSLKPITTNLFTCHHTAGLLFAKRIAAVELICQQNLRPNELHSFLYLFLVEDENVASVEVKDARNYMDVQIMTTV